MLDTLFPESFSPSTLEDIARCEFYFFRKHCQRFTGYPTSHHLKAGGLVAKACEMIRKDFYLNNLSLEESILNAEEYILSSPDTGSFEKSNEDVVRVIKRYFRKYPLNNYFKPIALPNGNICVEYKFQFDTGIKHPELNKNILFTGILDLLGEIDVPGVGKRIIILDEKSTDKLARVKGNKFVDLIEEEKKFIFSGQFFAYKKACEILGIKVDDVVIRRLPFNKEYTEPFEITIPMGKYRVDTWFNGFIAKIEDLKLKYLQYKGYNEKEEMFFWPVYSAVGCNAYFSTCPFLDGCLYPKGEQILTTNLIQGITNRETGEVIPLSEYKKGLGL